MTGEESFLGRFSRRKLAERCGADQSESAEGSTAREMRPPRPRDPLPDPATLGPDDDYTPFLSPEVEEAVHRLALRRLWRIAGVDGADDLEVYGGDYRTFAGLGELVTAELRYRIEIEARHRLEIAAQAGEAEPESPGPNDPPEGALSPAGDKG